MKSRERILDEALARHREEIRNLKVKNAGFEVLVRTIRGAINVHLEEEDNGKTTDHAARGNEEA